MRYQFYRNNVSGSDGLNVAALDSSTNHSLEHTVQLDDTQVISDRIVNETRFEYTARQFVISAGKQAPTLATSAAPSFGVPACFPAAATAARPPRSHSDHYELQNYITLSEGKQAIKFGAWLRDDREATSTDGNFNGTSRFPSVTAFVDTWKATEASETMPQIAAALPGDTPQADACPRS